MWHDNHGVTGDTFRGDTFARHPNILDRLHILNPKAELVSLIIRLPLHEHLIKPINGARS